MFETLTEKFSSVFKKLRGYGSLTEKNIEEALREVRFSLLEADVHVGVVKSFLERTKARVLGQETLGSLHPGEQFLKVVHEELVASLGGNAKTLDFGGKPPHILLMVGLQGAGKTTTTAKLARLLKKQGRRPYLVPLDLNRPAAIEQLQVLAQSIDVPCHPTQPGDDPKALLKKALEVAQDRFCDVILVDSAGRLHVDEALMAELKSVRDLLSKLLGHPTGNPRTLLVVDAMAGQVAVHAAKSFHDLLNIDGLILTKLDGDAKGGAALSVQSVAGCPVYYTGVGEKVEDFEAFEPERLVSRLLDRGDILSLVEKANEAFDKSEVEAVGRRFVANQFNLEDFRSQLKQMKKLGSLSSLMGMLPGGKAMASKVDMAVVEKDMKKKEAIINSMTLMERTRDA